MTLNLLPVLFGLFTIAACVTACLLIVLPAVARARRAEDAARTREDRSARDAELTAKEDALRYRERVESDLRDRDKEVLRREQRLSDAEAALDVRRRDLEDREAKLREREAEFGKREEQIEEGLSRVADLTREEAAAKLMERIESSHWEAAQKRMREIEAQATEEAERRARDILLDAMERSAVACVGEATVSVIPIAGEDVKGRIIGREGRNIRSFEQITGVDLIIDDMPDAVVISCFDPVRREVARLTLVQLMADGRIHPARIEELHAKAEEEVRDSILEAARRAVETAQVEPLEPQLLELLGRLRFRTSYAQNVLDHSVEVSRLAGLMAVELGLDAKVAKRAGLLHDVGKALSPDHEGPHALTGMDYLFARGESAAVARAVGSHHRESDHGSPESVLVAIADSLSASRPGSRKESLDNYVKRLTALEQLANGFPGVDRSYAVQAGREIRVLVKPAQIDDRRAARLADEIARRIEKDLQYPGQIKVTVIRETRVQDVAR